LLARIGFEALATKSAGFAFLLGKPDTEGSVARSAQAMRERGGSPFPREAVPFAEINAMFNQ
jgi:hypothetical protein